MFVHGLVFTRTDGQPVNKDAITGTVKRACQRAKLKLPVHELLHSAKTAWAKKEYGQMPQC